MSDHAALLAEAELYIASWSWNDEQPEATIPRLDCNIIARLAAALREAENRAELWKQRCEMYELRTQATMVLLEHAHHCLRDAGCEQCAKVQERLTREADHE